MTCQCPFCLQDPEFIDKFKRINSPIVRKLYNNRCCVCLNKVGSTGECVPLLVALEDVHSAKQIGVLEETFDIDSAENGVLQCASCHINFFAEANRRIRPFVFSLPLPLLRYLRNYVKQSPKSRLPTMSVNEVLDKLVAGDTSDLLLDPTPILPYVGLYTLIRAGPPRGDEQPRKDHIHVPRVPGLAHTIQGAKFAPAPADATRGAARILDARALADTAPDPGGFSRVPMDRGLVLDRTARTTRDKIYWRLRTKPSVVLAQVLPAALHSIHHDAGVARQCMRALQLRYGRAARGECDGGDGSGAGSGERSWRCLQDTQTESEQRGCAIGPWEYADFDCGTEYIPPISPRRA